MSIFTSIDSAEVRKSGGDEGRRAMSPRNQASPDSRHIPSFPSLLDTLWVVPYTKDAQTTLIRRGNPTNSLMTRIAVVHYDEIALKGKNRNVFEGRLVRNIKQALHGSGYESIHRLPGRILIYLGDTVSPGLIREKLRTVFGIAYFSMGVETDQDLDTLKETSLQLVQAYAEPYETLRINTKRSNKSYPILSPDLNAAVGAHVLEHVDARVDLRNADLTCHIEIVNRTALVYLGRVDGLGGLPVGVSGRVATMLSGGIDSPVAAWRMMRRGCRTDFIHFYSYPYTDKASLEKGFTLVELLTQFQFRSKLYLVPFSDVQLQIITKAPPRLRVILYRRMMIRIAERLATQNGYLALVTGESLAQVASQTLNNLRTIEAVADTPILRPLIGYDKLEIMREAEKIGTFEVSTLPYDDCCSLFVPDNPATGAKTEEAEQGETDLDIAELIEKALEQTELREFSTLPAVPTAVRP